MFQFELYSDYEYPLYMGIHKEQCSELAECLRIILNDVNFDWEKSVIYDGPGNLLSPDELLLKAKALEQASTGTTISTRRPARSIEMVMHEYMHNKQYKSAEEAQLFSQVYALIWEIAFQQEQAEEIIERALSPLNPLD